MATTNNPLTAAAKAIAAAQAKVASAQKVQRTATNSYKTSVNALATAQKAVKTLTSLKGGLTLKNAQTALAAAQRVVGAAQTIVKSTQMAVNTTTTTVKKLTGQGGSAGNPAIDNAIKQRKPYNAQTNTGTGPTMSSGQGLLNIPGATQIARNQADPEGNVNASRPQSRPEEFSSADDQLGVSSTENTPVTAAVADASGGSNAVASSNPIVQPATGTQVTQETTTVSGGGTTYVTAGIPKANAASDAVQPAIDVKQAEIDQFNKDNPSNLTRKKQGLPPLTPEESQQRQEKLLALNKEKSSLVDKQNDLKTPESTPPVVVPNTTTTTSTTVTSKAAVQAEVDPEDDESLGQQVSEQSRFRVPEFGSGGLTDVEQVDLTAAAAGGGSQRIDRQEDGPQPVISAPVVADVAAAGGGSQRIDRQEDGPQPVTRNLVVTNAAEAGTGQKLDRAEDGPVANNTSVNGGAAIAGGGGSSTSTVSGTFKMGQPSGPITFNGQVVNPGDPDYPAASAALIEARDRLRNPVVKKTVAPAAAAAGSGERDTTNNELGGDVPDPTPIISPAPVSVVDTNAGELGDRPPIISPAPVGDPEGTANIQDQNAAANAEAIRNAGELGNRPVVSDPAPVVEPPLTTGDFARADRAATIDQDLIQGLRARTVLQPTLQARNKQPASADWRVRLQLAPGATYLYNAPDADILQPLAATDGVIFPYTPSIETSYDANYDKYDLTHSNFRGYFYKGSKVNDINIRAIFTAQDTREAGYMLAVIHFFRSVTKMFYGANDPLRGAPPPLTYLTGLGPYQFNQHPCVVQSFNYSLPSEVDYIRTEAPNNNGTNLGIRRSPGGRQPPSTTRLGGTETKPPTGAQRASGETSAAAAAAIAQNVNNLLQATYVPTKIEISLVLLPINTRSQVSQQFNMQGFANGRLLRAGFW